MYISSRYVSKKDTYNNGKAFVNLLLETLPKNPYKQVMHFSVV